MDAARLYAGLISGTSMDGADAALCRFGQGGVEILGHCTFAWPSDLRRMLQRLALPGADGLDLLGEADRRAGDFFAHCLLDLLQQAKVAPAAITAVGSHGQTVRHRPSGAAPFTLQIGDPNRIAQLTGITTVADLRRRDMAAGGQGAPLVCGLHQALFASANEPRAVLNIGGIANLTLLHPTPDRPVIGFDTGPGNTLMDAWCRHHRDSAFDEGGRWAAGAGVSAELLSALLNDPYFEQAPPKTTGPEYFSPSWLHQRLEGVSALSPQAVQSTLLQLTVESIQRQLSSYQPDCARLLVCGGGVHNLELMRRLAEALPRLVVESTEEHGLNPDMVEAAAFAWMARESLAGRPGNVPSVTGARESVLLGGIYPGRHWPGIS